MIASVFRSKMRVTFIYMFFIGQESKDIIFNDFLNINKQNTLMIIQKRKEWIDALRGIAMIIVMVWHFSNGVNGQYIV